MFLAEGIYFRVNLVPNPACPLEFFFRCPPEFRGIVERPLQASSDTGKYRTTFSLSFATNRDDVLKDLTRFPHIKNPLGFVFGDVDLNFPQRLDHERIDCARFETSALRFK